MSWLTTICQCRGILGDNQVTCGYYDNMKSLKISKVGGGESEYIHRRRTNNIMVKIKRTRNDLQNIKLKTKD